MLYRLAWAIMMMVAFVVVGPGIIHTIMSMIPHCHYVTALGATVSYCTGGN